jgi:transposase-like protein
MKKPVKHSSEVMERAVRMVFEAREQHESPWAAIVSIAGQIGCSAERLRRWVRRHERDTGQREGSTNGRAGAGQSLGTGSPIVTISGRTEATAASS